MTIASEDRLKQYIGSGNAGPFPITFTIFNKGDLKVQRTIISTGVSTELTLDAGTDGYTVDTTLENITLTETIDSDERLTIEGSLDFLQPIDYIPNSTFPSEVTEQGFDRLTMLIQQVKSLVDKAFRLPTSSANTPGELPEPVDGKALVWDGTGGDIRNSVINVDDFSTALTDAQTAATAAELAQTGAETAETNAAASAASAAVSAGLLPQNDFAQSGPPDADNDVTEGFSTGSRWFDTVGQEMYTCLDATVGVAIWEKSTLTIDDLGGLLDANGSRKQRFQRSLGDFTSLDTTLTLTVTPIPASSDAVNVSQDGVTQHDFTYDPSTGVIGGLTIEDSTNEFLVTWISGEVDTTTVSNGAVSFIKLASSNFISSLSEVLTTTTDKIARISDLFDYVDSRVPNNSAIPIGWGSYDGATNTLLSVYGDLTVTKLAAGRYQVNLPSPRPSTNYCVTLGGGSLDYSVTSDTYALDSFRVVHFLSDNNTYADSRVNFVVYAND